MALEIFKLVGNIFVDNEEANKSISKTDEKAQSVGKTLADGVGKAAKWGGAILSGAAAAVGGITALATKTADNMDVIDKASQRMGISAEEYQKLSYAAGMSGVEMSAMETAAKTLAKTMPEADLTSVIAELAAMTDETERTARATELLGSKAAYSLTPMLNAGADGITALMDECEALGMVMSNDTVAAGATLGDTISSIKQSFEGMVAQLGAVVMPIVQEFADFIKENLPFVQALFEKITPVLTNLMESMLPPLMDLVEMLLPIIIDLVSMLIPPLTEILTAVLPIIIELLNMLLPPLLDAVQAILPALMDIINALLPILTIIIDLLAPILDLVLGLLAPIITLISSAIAPVIEILVKLINIAMKPIMGHINVLANLLKNVLGKAFEYLGGIINNIKGVFSGLIEFITGVFSGDWEKAFSGLGKIVKNIFEAMVSYVKAPINFLIAGMNAFIGMLNNIKIPDWVPGVGGKGFNLPTIPELAEGGIVGNGQLFIANEENPEMVGSYDGKSAVVNNQQIVQAITAAVTNAMMAFLSELRSVMGGDGGSGDIIIPIYLGTELLDEAIVTSKERVNFRSGGRANV